jgi:hypothetical protein
MGTIVDDDAVCKNARRLSPVLDEPPKAAVKGKSRDVPQIILVMLSSSEDFIGEHIPGT